MLDAGLRFTCAGGETGLTSVWQAFSGFIDDGDAWVAEGNFAGAVGAGVVDDDDLDLVAEEASLREDGLEAGRQITFFVVGRDDEA